MNQQELDWVRLTAHLQVVQEAVQLLYKTVARASPSAALSLRELANQWRRQAELLPLPWAKPEYADLLSAEYLEALDRFLAPVEDVLPP